MFVIPCYNVYVFTIYAHSEGIMRTNILIDDDLMAQALKATGLKTKKDVVEQGLILLVKRKKQQLIRSLRGQIKWEGDLDEMRENE